MQLAGRILLVVALLVARGGAVTHAYAHLANDPPSLPTSTCDECLSFAPLLSVVGGSENPILIEHREVDDLVSPATFPIACVTRPAAFQSRAPPALL
jgi:hypothetical protein